MITIMYISRGKITEFFNSFRSEKINEFSSDIETLKGRLKELADKPVKLTIDTWAIAALEKRIGDLEARKAKLEATKQSLGQKGTEEAATAALTGQDYSSTDIANSIATVMRGGHEKNQLAGADAARMAALPGKIDRLREDIKNPAHGEDAGIMIAQLDGYQKELKALQKKE